MAHDQNPLGALSWSGEACWYFTTSPPSSLWEDDPQWLSFHSSALVQVGTRASCLKSFRAHQGAPVNVLGKVVPTPAWQPGTKQELRGQLTGRSVGLPLPQPGGGGGSDGWGSQARQTSELGWRWGLSAVLLLLSVHRTITVLPMKKMRMLLAPLEQPRPYSLL